MKTVKILLLVGTTSLAVNSAHANETVDKATESVSNFFTEVKETTIETTGKVVDKSTEIGREAGKRAKESGEILWDKTKNAGKKTSDFIGKGIDKISGDKCELETESCVKKTD
ncbi:hypothetical protein O1D97_11290 [Marinomonas sp. 15G1-11]|uniref:Uncharacterized protein n=1 Tax=Marinomonas phaeophyticola TaxID=3004091 RepID=A0ABT4JVD8_9GAMM|nr:hypothetical protein [Marinomonas sp. 15G1-11]MCZ2722205.1 hypothetical protein [Marinomonas sp. 15G1-11]